MATEHLSRRHCEITEADLLQSLGLWFKEHLREQGVSGNLIGPDIGRPFEA
jgi:hypothetical protein